VTQSEVGPAIQSCAHAVSYRARYPIRHYAAFPFSFTCSSPPAWSAGRSLDCAQLVPIAGVLAAQAFAPKVEATLLKDEDVSGKKGVCFSVQTKHIGNGLIIHAYFTQPTSGYIELNGANGKHCPMFIGVQQLV
jgi:hypothetical protein